MEKAFVENKGNTHIDACGWSFLPMGCPQSGPLGRYCTGPNNGAQQPLLRKTQPTQAFVACAEDTYVYDWLHCKLKGDGAACGTYPSARSRPAQPP